MKTTYLGMVLRSPVVVSSSPFTSSVEAVERCVEFGAGAVVLKSIFEEQILHHAAALERQNLSATGMGDAGEYLERYLGDDYLNDHLRLLRRAVKCGVPVIGSVNCVSNSEKWRDYACMMADEGAAAIELNIFLLPTSRHESSDVIERRYCDIAVLVAEAVKIPVAVKLPLRLTNTVAMADRLLARGVRGVVLYNRFFEPDIDIESRIFVQADPFSSPLELRNALRYAGLCAAALPQIDVAVSTGVHDGAAAVKAILCGATAVQVCSAIHFRGYGVIRQMNDFIDNWAARQSFENMAQFRGLMSFGAQDDEAYQRVQYMRYFPDA